MINSPEDLSNIRNFREGFTQYEFTQHSTGLSLGNQVDGSPVALHTEAVWGGQGALGPAAIDTLDNKQKI